MFCFCDPCKYPNNLNSLFYSDCLMPIPVSSTYIFKNCCLSYIWSISSSMTSSSWRRLSTMLTNILMEPLVVNFKAFDYRLRRTCWIRCSSWVIKGECYFEEEGSSLILLNVADRLNPIVSAFICYILMTFFTDSIILNSL